jgi:hypothetical protein
LFGKGTENGTKKPPTKPGTKGRWPKGKANRVPRVKVLNYLKKVALFFFSYSFRFYFIFLNRANSLFEGFYMMLILHIA